MNEINIGIKETQEAFNWFFDLTDAIVSSIEGDGKVTVMDAPNFFKAATGAPAALTGADKIPLEILGMSKEQEEKIKQLIVTRFNLSNQDIEVHYENILMSLIQLARNVGRLYKMKK